MDDEFALFTAPEVFAIMGALFVILTSASYWVA